MLHQPQQSLQAQAPRHDMQCVPNPHTGSMFACSEAPANVANGEARCAWDAPRQANPWAYVASECADGHNPNAWTGVHTPMITWGYAIVFRGIANVLFDTRLGERAY